MRLNWRIAMALGLALAVAAPATAEEPAPGDGVKSEQVEPTKKVLRIVRARRVLNALQEAYDKARAQPEIDEKHLARLEEALEDAKAMTKAITLDELTENERKALAKELKKLESGDEGEDEDEADGEGNDRRDERTERALARAFEDAKLTEDEEAKATPIIADWYGKSMTAWRDRDSKAQSDLKRERDKELKKILGRKKAQKIINNLNSLGGRRW